ncbi:hypothetical protein CN585_30345 [Bacillus toyonensis]|uniref:DDE domain-containing protein n=1 Tax=Bacillus toyonensis TaxID=155322 RepID=A0A2A8H241_9BACI|nr:hypothetical protein CN585_30345 [Bacillus toyonensis]
MYQIWKKKNKTTRLSWYWDETYIKIQGEWCYLFRTIDKDEAHLGYSTSQKARQQGCVCLYEMLRKNVVRTNGSHN